MKTPNNPDDTDSPAAPLAVGCDAESAQASATLTDRCGAPSAATSVNGMNVVSAAAKASMTPTRKTRTIIGRAKC